MVVCFTLECKKKKFIKNGLGKPSPFLLPKENQNENAAARGRSSCAEILLYHSPRYFVNRQIVQTFRQTNPEICAFCTVDFCGLSCYTNNVERERHQMLGCLVASRLGD